MNFKILKIAAWNIHSVNDKLSEKNVKNLLDTYAFVFLTEIKPSRNITCTGFTVFQNSAKQGHRGGIALLIKHYLKKFVCNLDRSYENIISFELTFLPNILFLGCYLTLRDSQYYDPAIFGYIKGILKRAARQFTL